MSKSILDASAVLALLFGEPGSTNVQKYLSGAEISAVSFSECLAQLLDKTIPIEHALLWLNKLNLTVYPFDFEVAAMAASLRAATQGQSITVADRACLATAILRRGRVLTARREWSKLPLDVEIVCIRGEFSKHDKQKK